MASYTLQQLQARLDKGDLDPKSRQYQVIKDEMVRLQSHASETAKPYSRFADMRRENQAITDKEDSLNKAELDMHRADSARDADVQSRAPRTDVGPERIADPAHAAPYSRLSRMAELAPGGHEAAVLSERDAENSATGIGLGMMAGGPFGMLAGGAVGGGVGSAVPKIMEGAPLEEVAVGTGLGASTGLGLGALLKIAPWMVKSLRNHTQFGDDVALVERGGGRPATFSSGGIKDPPAMDNLTLGGKAPRQIAERHAPAILHRVQQMRDKGAEVGAKADEAFYATPEGRKQFSTGGVLQAIDDELAANRATPTGEPKSLDLEAKLKTIRKTFETPSGAPPYVGARDVQGLLRDQVDELARYGRTEGGKLTEESAGRLAVKLRRQRAKNWPEFEDVKAPQEKDIGELQSIADAFGVPNRKLTTEQMLGDRKIMEAIEAKLEQVGTKTLDFSDPAIKNFIARNPGMEQLLNEIASVGATTRLQTRGGGAGLSASLKGEVNPRAYGLGTGARLRSDPFFRAVAAGRRGAGPIAEVAAGQAVGDSVSSEDTSKLLQWLKQTRPGFFKEQR